MIVHVMGHSMYTTDFYSFINDNFDHSNQLFVTGKAKDPRAQSPIGLNRQTTDVEIVAPKNILRYISVLDAADGIVLHGIFSAKHLMLISKKKEWLRKSCWVVWGGDIYRHNDEHRRFREKAEEYFKIKYGPEIGYIAPLVRKDLPLVEQWYRVKGEAHFVSYPVPLHRKGVLERILKQGYDKHVSSDRTVNIVLGNSATKTNCHMEALDVLAGYRDQNIKLYIPLSYGFHGYEEYAGEVLSYAWKIFGTDKVVPILEKMDGEEYTDFLSKMDVAVFYNDRQQAMGNIAILLASGAKIYIRDDTNMWEHYKTLGYSLDNAYDISSTLFADFCTYNQVKKENNMGQIKKYLDIRIIREKWQRLFEAMEGDT